uniref:FAD-binding oxidoreductase/transferase type 4 C-terminal domain-containing protein n=1 Tax=Solanum lycopersicum TaxID=4081 RepID=A0A3Q7GVW6_SOLLC
MPPQPVVGTMELDASPLTWHVFTVAHAGDGNFHVVVQFDPTKEEQPREVVRWLYAERFTTLKVGVEPQGFSSIDFTTRTH